MTPRHEAGRRFPALAGRLLLARRLAAGAATGAPADPWAEPGPHAGTSIDTVWTDAARNRTLPIRLQMPAATAARLRPTILFSHGLGGSRAAGDLWGRHWACR